MSDVSAFLQAAADDILQLGRLHDRELDTDTIAALKAVQFPTNLGVALNSEAGLVATAAMTEVVQLLPEEPSQELLEDLAADYADIYLNYTLKASPCESVWLDEDQLTHQEPMFEIRDVYASYGVEVENWRKRSDDHLVLQLQFIAMVLNGEKGEFSADQRMQQVAAFLDHHLLLWIDDFSETVSQRCSTSLYAALVKLTHAYIDEFRDQLAHLLDQQRPGKIEMLEARDIRKRESRVQVKLPDASINQPSW